MVLKIADPSVGTISSATTKAFTDIPINVFAQKEDMPKV